MNTFFATPQLLKEDYHVMVTSAFERTQQNFGYNFNKPHSLKRVYFHAPKTSLPAGRYIVCYKPSTLVSNRDDTFAVIAEKEFIQYVAEQLDLSTLNIELVRFITVNKTNNEISTIVESLLLKKVNTLLDGDNTVDSKGSQYLLQHCKTLELKTPQYLYELLTGQITTLEVFEEKGVKTGLDKTLSAAQRQVVAKTLFDAFTDIVEQVRYCFDQGILSEEIKALASQAMINNTDLAVEFNHKTFEWLCFTNDFLMSNDDFSRLFKAVDIEKRKQLAKTLPPERITDYLMNFGDEGACEVIKALSVDVIIQQIDDNLQQLIAQNYPAFLQCLTSEHAKLCDIFPIEDLPLYVNYVSQAQLNKYLLVWGASCHAEAMAILRTSAQQKAYFESLLLIALFEQKLRQGGTSVQSITALFDDFQKGLFDHHAKTRTQIELSILPACKVLQSSGSNKIRSCEGKLWYVKVKNEQGSVVGEAPKALCRRRDCPACVFQGMENTDPNEGKGYRYFHITLPRAHSFQTLPFYELVAKLFHISAEQLHQHDAFIRMLSALNRWNEILEKLICRKCKNPLQISEHARGSIGHLAVGTTYWQCGSEDCECYSQSVKISYCIGCQKSIDSRDDKQSCTPYEVRSYKKFYICNDCGSCCSKHGGFAGICPHCGKDKAFVDVADNDRTRAQCKHCNKVTNIGYFGFQALQKHKQNGGVLAHIGTLSKAPSHLAGSLVDASNQSQWVVWDTPWNVSVLYIYDLYECLRSGYITRQMLSKYDGVHDLKVIEKMATLGTYHQKYGTQQVQSPLEALFEKSIQAGGLHRYQQAIFDLVHKYFNILHENNLWDHYYNVEYKFILALYDLSQSGLNIHASVIKTALVSLEKQRNIYVHKLSLLKVFDTDMPTLSAYLAEQYDPNDADMLLRYLERHGPKVLRDSDNVFEYLYGIEKAERAARIMQSMLALPSRVKPQYQIVGTSTSRCTSRFPNLMNLPKDSRYVVRAAAGNCIIECDYKQMEIGVLAALSDDLQLITDFNSGDVYAAFAKEISATRDQAKMVLLGIIYGMSAASVAAKLAVTLVVATSYIEHFFIRYPKVKLYQDQLIHQGASKGYVESITGLRRSTNKQVLKTSTIQYWERNWFKNFPIQSSAASVFKQSFVELSRELRGDQFRLLVPHYDAMVFEVPVFQAEHYISQVKAAMIRAMRKYFPLLTPQISVTQWGEAWGEPSKGDGYTATSVSIEEDVYPF
ncbi:hypothetical protein CTM88_13675 [Photobacterium aquimaris]|uniref:DNA polymerase I n=2 Tax=Photobacterium aquimaris TaxID=512643 RepID=A0A2T3IIK7_9GAMM|nr:DNA polymerase [Photobacterium aquimaris]PSU28178.1 hypothetical protein CTM88_13675 [Photobacterium aquimaris]